jgi:ABC-type Fe3+-hydroxamate transport system substrate-binding protein
MAFQDQMGRLVQVLRWPPRRIISLVPSQTELLDALGLEAEVVGITKFCVHPTHWRRSKTIVGGTKNLHFDRIEALRPDLIIGNKEENEKSQIEYLMARYPVWMSDIYQVQDALEMIRLLGRLCNKPAEADTIAQQIQAGFGQLTTPQKRPSALYLIWRAPYMGAAAGTFVHDMLGIAGFSNCLAGLQRYPVLEKSDIQALAPEVIFLSSEPYPFREKHIVELQEISPNSKIMTVDGELFSWYGNRLLKSAAYFRYLREKLEI